MTGKEWAKLRKKFGTQAEVAAVLKTPTRTLQDWEASDEVKGVVEVAMVLLLNDTERLLDKIQAGIEARLDREFPNGI